MTKKKHETTFVLSIALYAVCTTFGREYFVGKPFS